MNRKGIYLSTIATVPLLLQMLWTSIIGSKKAKLSLPPCTTKELDVLENSWLLPDGDYADLLVMELPIDQLA